MHEPRPHGLLAVGGELTEDDSALVEAVARRLTNLKTLSGANSFRMVRSLPNGGYVIAQDMGGVFRCITHKPEHIPQEPTFDGLATDFIPALFSGVVTKAILQPEEGLKMTLTNQTRRRLGGYDPAKTVKERVELERFKVKYGTRFFEFEPKYPTILTHTQYAQLRPTWYSGTMAEVVQIVGGYGRQDFDSLPDNSLERSRMVLPRKVLAEIQRQLINIRLPGYTGMPDRKGEILYDYKFSETHGVAFDSSNKPWLLQVSQKGVYAMPLPLVPATTTGAFREYIEEVSDSEILAILDRFGGMPSGESFPVRVSDFQAWLRAGVIIKICDTDDFYQNIAYSSACGWSFSLLGTEACNTCYNYDDDEGLGYGLAYKMSIKLQPAQNDGKLPDEFDLEGVEESSRLDAYLSALYKRLRNNESKSLAIKYKLRRVPVQKILLRTGSSFNSMASEIEYWDALELEPIASHNGSVKRFSEGWLYHPAKFEFQPQIKFPEPFQDGCVSHNFEPLINGRYKESYPTCDTIMFCYYIENSLKVVKYFRDGRSYQRKVENDYEPCMTVGSWSQVESGSRTFIQGDFYTTDIDERIAVTPTETTTKIVGKDLGYNTDPYFSFDGPFHMQGTMVRNRFFSQETSWETVSGQSLSVGVCIPYFMRNALIYGQKKSIAEKSSGRSGRRMSVRDPWSYRFWTYDFIVHWIFPPAVQNGRPYPKDSNPVWVEVENYNPTQCSDFADQGSWVPGLPADYTWLIHPESNSWFLSGGGGAPPYSEYSFTERGGSEQSGNMDISINAWIDNIHKKVPDNRFFLGSPDPNLGPYYRDACKNVFGEAEYSNTSEIDGSVRKRWGHTTLADHKSAHHFLGVINE